MAAPSSYADAFAGSVAETARRRQPENEVECLWRDAGHRCARACDPVR